MIRNFFIVFFVGILGVGLFNIFNIKSSFSSKENTTKKVYEHIFPERFTENSYYNGKVIRNDYGVVHPRRDAIIKDVLVTIGDEVEVGDTLAVLFNPGVAGESQKIIDEKIANLNLKKQALKDKINLSGTRISEIDSKIKEKETLLNQVKINSDILIEKSKSNYEDNLTHLDNLIEKSKKALSSEKQNLKTLQNDLENKLNVYESTILEKEKIVSQRKEIYEITQKEIISDLKKVLFIGKDKINLDNISAISISDYLAANDNDVRQELLSIVSDIDGVSALSFINIIESALEHTPSNSVISSDKVAIELSKLHGLKRKYFDVKQSLDLSVSSLENTENIELEKINSLKNKIENQKKVIDVKASELDLALSNKKKLENGDLYSFEDAVSDKNLQTEKILSEIETLKSTKKSLIASEDSEISKLEKEVSLAETALDKSYVKYSDYLIKSPFSGKISSVNFGIGDFIKKSDVGFTMIGVDNYLSNISVTDVSFSVPVGDEVGFNLGDEVKFNYGSVDYFAEVYQISSESSASNSILIKAKVASELTHNSIVQIIRTTPKDKFLVPNTVIYKDGDDDIVYFKKPNGKFGKKSINLISDSGEKVLISGDITEDLKIVSTPLFFK